MAIGSCLCYTVSVKKSRSDRLRAGAALLNIQTRPKAVILTAWPGKEGNQ